MTSIPARTAATRALVIITERDFTKLKRENIRKKFDQIYEKLYGRTYPDSAVEFINFKVRASLPERLFKFSKLDKKGQGLKAAVKGQRLAYSGIVKDFIPYTVYDRYKLFPNAKFKGPAMIEEKESTLIVGEDTTVSVVDTLVEWNREVLGNVIGGLNNQRYVETPQGYIYSSVLQPTRNLPNTPIAEMPAGLPGFWAEVTVPYVDLTHEGTVASPWLQDHILYNFPPRLYYGQVVWIDQIRNVNGFVEYRWNEDAPHGNGYGAYGEVYWADGAAFKILTDADVAPISPDVAPDDKRIDVDLDFQTLSCYEGTTEVYFCRISSGIKNILDPATGTVDNKLLQFYYKGVLNSHEFLRLSQPWNGRSLRYFSVR